MRDLFAEVFASMKNNRMRITLTGFSIAWGLFILIVLLGAGNGLLSAMEKNFSSAGENVVTLTPGKTSMAYQGFEKGRPVYLKTEDCQMIERELPDHIKQTLPILVTKASVYYKTQYISLNLEGQTPGYNILRQMHLTQGRDLNQADLKDRRKVCVITQKLKDILFDKNEDAVGKYVNVFDIPFLVVGVCEPDSKSNTTRGLYVPLTVAMTLYAPEGRLTSICLLTKNLNTKEDNELFANKLQNILSSSKEYADTDKKAISIDNPYEIYVQVKGLLYAIYVFICIVGLAILISGVVGINNIMLITVNERTRELGVRKAMGASNASIIALVLLESVIITLIFGYIGMMLGIGITQLAAFILASANSQLFGAPTISLTIIFGANVIMLLAGLIAGYIPAKRAVSIKLVDALTA